MFHDQNCSHVRATLVNVGDLREVCCRIIKWQVVLEKLALAKAFRGHRQRE